LDNSREHVSSISKKIRLRRENTNYRISRMIREGFIRDFNTIFNEKLLKLDHYGIFFQLMNLNPENEKNIIKYLESNPYVTWVGISAGKWTIVADIIIPKNKDLDNVIKNILEKLKNYVDEYVISKLHEIEYYDYKLIVSKGEDNKKEDIKEDIILDKTDWKIIELLNKNSRINYVDISEKTKLTPNAINNRIKNLEKNKVINKYTISLNWKKFGYEWYGLQFKINKFDQDFQEKIKNYLRNHPNISFFYKYIGGPWDYDIGVTVKNSNELREFINKFRFNFPKEIKITDVYLVLEQTSEYKLPKGVFENQIN